MQLSNCVCTMLCTQFNLDFLRTEAVGKLNTVACIKVNKKSDLLTHFLGNGSCICRKLTPLRDGHSLPPSDHLLRFLVESTCEEFPKCANCDRNEKSPMFFCNTCGKTFRISRHSHVPYMRTYNMPLSKRPTFLSASCPRLGTSRFY